MEVIDMGDFNMDKKVQTQEPPPKPKPEPTVMPVKVSKKALDKLIPKQEDDVKQHQEYVLMLSRYGASPRFGKYLKELTFNLSTQKLKKMPLEELQDLLERVRTSVANKTVSDVWSESVLGGLAMGENIVTMTKLGEKIKIQGLSEALKEDECFLDLLEELKLENQNLAYVSPYVRLSYMILTTGARVHGFNSMMEKRNNKNAPKIDLGPSPTEIKTQEKEEEKVITTKKKRVRPEEKIIDISA